MSKYREAKWWSDVTQSMRMQDVIMDIDARLSALEEVAHTPSEAECKPQETGTPERAEPYDYTIWSVGTIALELVAVGVGYSNHSRDDLIAELERRIEADKPQDRPDESILPAVKCCACQQWVNIHQTSRRRINDRPVDLCHKCREALQVAQLPAPAASEPTSDGLFVQEQGEMISPYGHKYISHRYLLATPAHIRQAAVAMGLLDTPRQKAAEKLLHATIMGVEKEGTLSSVAYSLNVYADKLKQCEMFHGEKRLCEMAAVLEAAKGEQ